MTTLLPERPNLEQLGNQAKSLLKAHRASDPEAILRVTTYNPLFPKDRPSKSQSRALQRADALFVVAREHGFESWPKLKAAVENLARTVVTDAVPSAPVDEKRLRIVPEIVMRARTDMGRVKQRNTDRFEYTESNDLRTLTKGAFYSIADGYGGELAVTLATANVRLKYYEDPSDDVHESLRRAIDGANTLIHEISTFAGQPGMGASLTVAVMREDKLTIAHVGACRGYMIRRGQIVQITDDHTWAMEQFRAGAMTDDEAKVHSRRGELTRAVGMGGTVEAEVTTETIRIGDIVVLCTNGLSDVVAPEEILAIARAEHPRAAADRLVDIANERGGEDNITVMVMRVAALNLIDPTLDVPAKSAEEQQDPPQGNWQRFTERARRAIFFAQEDAKDLGEKYVSTEHLLLGLVREDGNVAARLLGRMGVTCEQVRAEIMRQVAHGGGPADPAMQLTPRAKQVIDLAYDEARLLNTNYIGTEHLLLGLVREGKGLAGRVLTGFGVTVERARKEWTDLTQGR